MTAQRRPRPAASPGTTVSSTKAGSTRNTSGNSRRTGIRRAWASALPAQRGPFLVGQPREHRADRRAETVGREQRVGERSEQRRRARAVVIERGREARARARKLRTTDASGAAIDAGDHCDRDLDREVRRAAGTDRDARAGRATTGSSRASAASTARRRVAAERREAAPGRRHRAVARRHGRAADARRRVHDPSRPRARGRWWVASEAARVRPARPARARRAIGTRQHARPTPRRAAAAPHGRRRHPAEPRMCRIQSAGEALQARDRPRGRPARRRCRTTR